MANESKDSTEEALGFDGCGFCGSSMPCDCEPDDSTPIDLEVTEHYGFLGLRKRKVLRHYRGSGTVWLDLRNGRRASTRIESVLSDMESMRAFAAADTYRRHIQMCDAVGPLIPLAGLMAWLEEIEEQCPDYSAIRLQTSSIRHAAFAKWGGGKTEEEVRG